MLYEQIIVWAIVGVALFYVGRALWRSWRGKAACGCGSANCPAAREAADRLFRTVERPGEGTRPASGRARGVR